MAVDKYKDDCAVLDLKDPFGIATCKELADKIWADFISLNSPNEVSLPSEDREETERRMKKPEVYGVNLFDVALKDALKTLQKDTLQRFLKSPQYTEMVNKLRSILQAETLREAQTTMGKTAINQTAPSSSSMKYEIDFPKKTNLTEEKIDSLNPKDLTLDEILNDRILFTEMLNYLERSKYFSIYY
jgi:hypothetical protein